MGYHSYHSYSFNWRWICVGIYLWHRFRAFIAFRVIQVTGDWEVRDALLLGGVIYFLSWRLHWSSSDWVNSFSECNCVHERSGYYHKFFVWLKMNLWNEKLYLWHQFRAFPFRVIQVIGYRAVRDAWLLGGVIVGCQGFLGVHSIQ